MKRIELPDKPSEMAELAYADFLKCFKDGRYQFVRSSTLVHGPNISENVVSHSFELASRRFPKEGFYRGIVSFSGCVVAKTMSAPIMTRVRLEDFDFATKVKLKVIDGLGLGLLVDPFDCFESFNRDTTFESFSHNASPDTFGKDFLDFAKELKLAGL